MIEQKTKQDLQLGSNLAKRSSSLRIPAISGLKVFALLGIFAWHAWGQRLSPYMDTGARMVEVFFACSGLLEALHHHGSYDYTLTESLELFAKKLKGVYPTYLLGFVAASVAGGIGLMGWSLVGNIIAAVICLLLLQAWFDGLIFAFDGASWFLSALLFCYLLTPLLSLIVRRFEQRFGYGWKAYVAPFVLFMLAGMFLEVASRLGVIAGTYAWPPFRFTEYGMAFIVGCAILKSGHELKPFMGGRATVVEIASVFGYVTFCLTTRKAFLVGLDPHIPLDIVSFCAALALVAVFVVCRGLLSSLLSVQPLQRVSSLELAFFLLHQPLLALANAPILIAVIPRHIVRALLAFGATAAISEIWVRWVLPKVTSCWGMLSNRFISP